MDLPTEACTGEGAAGHLLISSSTSLTEQAKNIDSIPVCGIKCSDWTARTRECAKLGAEKCFA